MKLLKGPDVGVCEPLSPLVMVPLSVTGVFTRIVGTTDITAVKSGYGGAGHDGYVGEPLAQSPVHAEYAPLASVETPQSI